MLPVTNSFIFLFSGQTEVGSVNTVSSFTQPAGGTVALRISIEP